MKSVAQRTRWTPSSHWTKWIRSTEPWPELHAIASGCHQQHSDEERRDSSLCPQCSAAYKLAAGDVKSERRAEMSDMNRRELAHYGLAVGQRVECFCPSMLGLGGVTMVGVVKVYRGRVCVDCGRKVDTSAGPRRYVSLGGHWKAKGGAA